MLLPTVIVVHPRENRKKCSVEPLRGREEFLFHTYHPLQVEPLPAGPYVRLGYGGPEISRADTNHGLLLLDGTWRWAEKMEAAYTDIPVRSLPPWITAYPRISKVFDDPSTGLATIEALFAALWHMGRPTEGLLDSYLWRERFLELNQDRLNCQ